MSLNPYNPVWPKTLIFWGAGATASLEMPITMRQGKVLTILGTDESLDQRIGEAFPFFAKTPKHSQALRELFLGLGDALNDQDPLYQEGQRLSQETRFQALRKIYDWGTLKQIIQISPKGADENVTIQDLFNLIDLHRASHHGFLNKGGEPIPPESLAGARQALTLILSLLFYEAYQQQLEQPETLRQYYEFAEALTQMMVEEGLRKENEGKQAIDREFYLFSYAVISMNWDPLLFWMLFNAHKASNERPSYLEINKRPIPMKLFHDMGHFMGIRKIDGKTPDVRYPLNEASAQRLNHPDHVAEYRVRMGKFYFPHGCLNGRECPSCGKWVVHLGDKWDVLSPTLFPSPILSQLNKVPREPKSQEEEEAFNQGQSDAVQCAYCGVITQQHHVPFLVQTNFKHNTPPFLEEIQRDMRVALEKAHHFIFMGYSLPSDDVLYRSLLAARQSRDTKQKICISIVVGYEPLAPDQWFQDKELEDYFLQNPALPAKKTFDSIQAIFGKKAKIRSYMKGIPAVFLSQNRADPQKVRTLLESW